MTFTPSAAQADAIDAVSRWYDDPHGDQVYRMFGFAGTGKTTLAQHIAAGLPGDKPVLYAAYSGKAANVLSRKGCTGAQTIHSLIYLPAPKSREQVKQLEEVIALERAAKQPDVARIVELEEELETALARFHKPSWTLR